MRHKAPLSLSSVICVNVRLLLMWGGGETVRVSAVNNEHSDSEQHLELIEGRGGIQNI